MGLNKVGVLSPIFFALYMDEMFYLLKSSGLGYYVGNFLWVV